MAEDKLVFPVEFEVDEAVEVAQKKLDKVELEVQLNIVTDDVVKKASGIAASAREAIGSIEIPTNISELDSKALTDLVNKISTTISQLGDEELDLLSDAELEQLKSYQKVLASIGTIQTQITKQRTLNDDVSNTLKLATAEQKRADAALKTATAQEKVKLILDKQAVLQAKVTKETANAQAATARLATAKNNELASASRLEAVEIRTTALKNKQATQSATVAKNTAVAANNTKNMASYANILVQRWITYNSLAQVVNFAKGIRETTAEFELQRVSLGALIQDAERANEIFEQIKASAVQSPFEIKDLVTYTKQLAAYGFGQEKVYDEMMKLADVSAGLGVGMDRLILAYGQVSAKGHLAGTELKQFTEAGIPLVQALTDQFNALGKEVYTTADIYDMISNKKISFSDVSGVFDSLTEAGGRFYDMQRIQSETLAGVYSNMKDSISIAMDEMGRDNRGLLLESVLLVKSMWENWESVAAVLKTVGVLGGIIYASQKSQEATQQKFVVALGKEKAERYQNILAIQEQELAQARLNEAVNKSLLGKGWTPSASVYNTKDALRQAIATDQLTKSEAARAIVLGQTTSAERKLMIQTGLLTKEQVKAALASQTYAKGGTLLARSLNTVSTAAQKAGTAIKSFFASNWITLVISALISLIFEFRNKAKDLAEETERITDEQKKLKQELDAITDKYDKDLAKGIDALIGKYKELGLEGHSALKDIDPSDSLVEQYGKLEKSLVDITGNIALIKSNIAEGFGDVEWGGILGENIKSDMEDFNKSLSQLYLQQNVEKVLYQFREELKYSTKDLSDIEKQRYAGLLDGQRVYESDIDYQKRLVEAYANLETEASKYSNMSAQQRRVALQNNTFDGLYKSAVRYQGVIGKLSSVQQDQLAKLSSAYQSAEKDIEEFSYELEKRINNVASSLDIQKLIKEGNTDALQDIALQIKAVFADPTYEFNEFAKQIGAEKYGDLLGIPIHFFAEFDIPTPQDLNEIQQALVGSGLFSEKDVANIKNKVDAQKALVKVVEEEAALKKIVAKADEGAYNTLMDQYATEAQKNIEEYTKKLETARAEQRKLLVGSEEWTEAGTYVDRLENGISAYTKQLEKSRVPFATFIENQADSASKMGENTTTAYTVAKAIGVLLDTLKSGGSGSGTDPWITLMKNRMAVMKDYQAGVTTLSKVMSKNQAIEQQQDIIAYRAASVGLSVDVSESSGTAKELSDYYQTVIEAVQKKIQGMGGGIFKEMTVQGILNTDTKSKTIKAYQELLQYAFNAKTDLDTKTLSDNITAELAKLSTQIEQQQVANDFFTKMLGITGDSNLAMSMTMSVYGDVAGDASKTMAERMAKATQDNLRKAFKGVDIEDFLNADGSVDWSGLQAKVPEIDVEAYRKQADSMVKAGLKSYATQTEQLGKILAKAKDFEQQRLDIEEEYNGYRILNNKKYDKLIAEATDKATEDRLKAEKAANEKAINKSQTTATAEVDVAEFKASDEWLKTFEDLDNLSTQSINNVLAKLDEYIAKNKEAMSAESLKTLTEARDKLYEESIERNPFQGAIDGLKEWVTATRDVKKAQEDLDATEEGTPEYDAAYAKYTDALDEQQKAQSKFVKSLNATANAFSGMESLLNDITDLLGIAEDSSAGAVISAVATALGVVAGILTVIAATLVLIDTLVAPLLIIAGVVAAITAIFSAISNAKVNKANKEIEKQAELIEQLKDAYEDLSRSMDKFSLGSDWIDDYNDQIENLEKQAEAARKQAEAEQSKGKKEDKDATKEYYEDQKEAIKQAKELREDFAEAIIGDSIAGFSKNIASIWLEAKVAGEDTMKALNDEYASLMQDMVANTVLAAAIEASLQPVFDKIDEMRENTALAEDPDYWASFGTVLSDALAGSDAVLENVYKALDAAGVKLTADSSGLEGIAKNISTASEEAVLGLSAGVATQNYYMATISAQVTEIRALMDGSAATGDDTLILLQNTYLAELPSISINTANTVAECRNVVAKLAQTNATLDVMGTKVGAIQESLDSVIQVQAITPTKILHVKSHS